MVNDLIFDVGVNNGDDTAYYLERGYRVVGVEANPRFIEHANHRFEREIREGSLRLINAAIGSREGTTEFHVSDGNRGVWSSLDGANASQKGTPTRLIEVRCVRFGSLLEEFGTPYYLKIDIEGADHFCIEDIDLRDPPAYVSFEANHGRLCDLFTLYAKGYASFKLIDQMDHFKKLNPPSLHSARLANATYMAKCRKFLKRRRVLVNGVRGAQRLFRGRRRATVSQDSASSAAHGVTSRYDFRVSSSGPMCEETDGTWDSAEVVAYAWLYCVRPSGWFDVHAKWGA